MFSLTSRNHGNFYCLNYLYSFRTENIPSGCSMSTILGFDHVEGKYNLCRGKDCMKEFFTSLTEHAQNVTDFEKKIVTVNQRRNKITSRCKSMLHLWKKNLKKAL